MFPTGNGPGFDNNICSQSYIQGIQSLPNFQNEQPGSSHPPFSMQMLPSQELMQQMLHSGQLINQNKSMIMHNCDGNSLAASNQSSGSNSIPQNREVNGSSNYEVVSDDDSMVDEDENIKKHPWQAVQQKRKRPKYIKSGQDKQSITVTNRYQSLSEENLNEEHAEKDNTAPNNTKAPQKDPKPPPIYIYGVTDYKAMTDSLALITEDETYYCKALSNNTVKINPYSADTYRKLIRYLRMENIVHHTYQLKQERAYRVVIRDLHHSMPLEDITRELEKAGHKVRNIINVRHRVSKAPLPLFFVDLEPQDNNSKIYDFEFLLNTKVKIEPPRIKKGIIQCTRCQDYGHSKTYCRKAFVCVKCGKSHDTKLCKKSNLTPATCALCTGNHPANYRGCMVYRDLVNARNRNNGIQTPRNVTQSRQIQANSDQTSPQGVIQNSQQTNTYSYAQAAAHNPNINPTVNNNNNNQEDITKQLTSFLNEFKNMFAQLLNQNSMILTMLTTVINKLAQ